MKVATKMLGALAASSMLLAQPAAAAVRSADSLPRVGSELRVDRASAPVAQAEANEGEGFLLPLLIGGSILTLLIVVLAGDSNESSDSPG